MTSASTPSRSMSLIRRCGSLQRRMSRLPSSYMPVSAILSTRWFCPGTNSAPPGPTPFLSPKLAPFLADPLRPLRPVLDIGHAVFEFARRLGDEQVGRHPRHVEMAVGRNSAVLHVVFPALVDEACVSAATVLPCAADFPSIAACSTRHFCKRGMNAAHRPPSGAGGLPCRGRLRHHCGWRLNQRSRRCPT